MIRLYLIFCIIFTVFIGCKLENPDTVCINNYLYNTRSINSNKIHILIFNEQHFPVKCGIE